jgi:tetrahydromethanopterin S-methyltransferase subunit C
MKRLYWTVGLALVGFYLGWYGQPYPGAGSPFGDLEAILVPVLGFGAVGFGLGTIFTRPRPGWGLVIAWMTTLALVSTFFGIGMIFPVKSFSTAEVLGGALGAVVGAVIGTLHRHRIRKRELSLPNPSYPS